MRYDFTRCNNLRWKCGDRTGFIKTDGNLVRVLADELWLSMHGEMTHYCVGDFKMERAEDWLDEHPDFEIIPRNPETYKDWQVGDVVVDPDGYYLDVAGRLEMENPRCKGVKVRIEKMPYTKRIYVRFGVITFAGTPCEWLDSEELKF